MNVNRFIVIVLDSVGIGELPDAADFGDVGSHTLGNIARVTGGLNLPNLEKIIIKISLKCGYSLKYLLLKVCS
jgi:phosphopentomutase